MLTYADVKRLRMKLAFLLSHCLEGDAILYQKVADGLNAIGDSC
jgi:hypothetical protein